MKFAVGEGKYRVELELIQTTNGLVAALTGGEFSHVGAVVLSLPRLSLSGSSDVSCDSFIIPVPGHKDHLPAVSVAEDLCCLTKQPVSVTAGIHIDGATAKDIELLMANCGTVLAQAAEVLK